MIKSKLPKMIRVAAVTVSDRCHAGARTDGSGDVLKGKLAEMGWRMASYEIVPDEEEIIRERLQTLVDSGGIDVIFTTGGTGLSPRDVTPEATRRVIQKEVPGMAEIMRVRTFEKAPFSVLSRAVCGSAKNTLIVNLPGSPHGVGECLEIILPVVAHAVEMITHASFDHEGNRTKGRR